MGVAAFLVVGDDTSAPTDCCILFGRAPRGAVHRDLHHPFLRPCLDDDDWRNAPEPSPKAFQHCVVPFPVEYKDENTINLLFGQIPFI